MRQHRSCAISSRIRTGRLTAAELKCAHRKFRRCASLGRYRPSFTATACGDGSLGIHGRCGGRPWPLAAAASAETVADLHDRWFNNYSGVGVGLYGGIWRYGGDHVVRFRLHKVRLTRDLAVSGRVTWSTYGHRLTCRLTVQRVTGSGHVVAGSAVDGTVSSHWNTRKRGAIALLTGDLGARRLHASLRAP